MALTGRAALLALLGVLWVGLVQPGWAGVGVWLGLLLAAAGLDLALAGSPAGLEGRRGARAAGGAGGAPRRPAGGPPRRVGDHDAHRPQRRPTPAARDAAGRLAALGG